MSCWTLRTTMAAPEMLRRRPPRRMSQLRRSPSRMKPPRHQNSSSRRRLRRQQSRISQSWRQQRNSLLPHCRRPHRLQLRRPPWQPLCQPSLATASSRKRASSSRAGGAPPRSCTSPRRANRGRASQPAPRPPRRRRLRVDGGGAAHAPLAAVPPLAAGPGPQGCSCPGNWRLPARRRMLPQPPQQVWSEGLSDWPSLGLWNTSGHAQQRL